MVLKNNYPTPAIIDISYIWKIKEPEVKYNVKILLTEV